MKCVKLVKILSRQTSDMAIKPHYSIITPDPLSPDAVNPAHELVTAGLMDILLAYYRP